ncbi:MAG: hypothetical protein ABIE14_00455, partial [Patescibacteria group bacterium]
MDAGKTFTNKIVEVRDVVSAFSNLPKPLFSQPSFAVANYGGLSPKEGLLLLHPAFAGFAKLFNF